jgi:Fe-S-cluster containining protein
MAPNPAGEVPSESPIGFMRAPTHQLNLFIADQQRSLPAAEFAQMVEQVRSVFEKYTAVLAGTPPGVERGRTLHRMIDSAIETAASVPVSCRYGCCGCCHNEVEVTSDEAALLRERVLGGVEIDEERLNHQASRERKSADWAKFWHPTNACVFLSPAGSCRIYEDRPCVCRRLLVTTPPEACTTAGAPVAPVRILMAEILLSAAASFDESGFASLSKMLQRALDE